MYDYLKYQKNLSKRIDKLFNGKYFGLVQVNDFLCSNSEFRYNISFSISKKNNTVYGSDYIEMFDEFGNDYKELGKNLIKYVKKSLKDGYFYRKSKSDLIADTYINLSELSICYDYKE